LDSANSDFLRYVKTEARRVQLAGQGYREAEALEIATVHHGASSRLRSMLEMPAGIFDEYRKAMQSPVDVHKAAVGVGGIDVGWGGALAPFAQASVAFLQSLSPYSAFDRILNDNAFYPLPMRTRIAITTTAAVGSAVPEDIAKPVSQMSFSQAQQPALKAIAQVILSDEVILLTTPAATRLFESEMQKAVAGATDAKFMQILVAGAGSTHASTGITAAAFLADLTTALQSIQTDVNSKLYLILPTNTWKAVLLLRDNGGMLVQNGKIANINVIPSSGAGTTGVLLDAGSVGADSDIVTPDTATVSKHATLEMADNPTSSDFHLVSLWQNNWSAIRLERFYSAVVMRSNGVAKITGYS
jgi:hypothetical protein